MKKSIFFLAILFLVASNSLWADDDIVWIHKSKSYFGGTVYDNNTKIVTYDGGSITHYHDTETGEEFHTMPSANVLFFINEDTEFFQITNNRKYLVKYRTNDFVALDSIAHDVDKFSISYQMSSNGLNLYEADTNKIRVWDIAQKRVVREISIPVPEYQKGSMNIDVIAIHSYLTIQGVDCDNKKLLIAQETEYELDNFPPMSSYVKTLAFYDTQTMEKLYSLGNNTKGSCVFSNTCKYIARVQGNVELYDFNTMELIRTFGGPIFNTVFTSDDKYLMTSDDASKNQIQLWDIEQNKLIKTYKYGSSKVLGITNDNQFAFCSAGSDFYKLRLNLDNVGIQDSKDGAIAYPNPAGSVTNLTINIKYPNIFDLQIIDLEGKVVHKKSLGHLHNGSNIITVDTDNLIKGQYSILIYSSSEDFNFNIVKGE